jgi:hypothetical protein
MRGRNPSADSAAGMAGGGSSRLHPKPFWPESDKSQGFGGCVREDLMNLLIERNQLG